MPSTLVRLADESPSSPDESWYSWIPDLSDWNVYVSAEEQDQGGMKMLTGAARGGWAYVKGSAMMGTPVWMAFITDPKPQ